MARKTTQAKLRKFNQETRDSIRGKNNWQPRISAGRNSVPNPDTIDLNEVWRLEDATDHS